MKKEPCRSLWRAAYASCVAGLAKSRPSRSPPRPSASAIPAAASFGLRRVPGRAGMAGAHAAAAALGWVGLGWLVGAYVTTQGSPPHLHPLSAPGFRGWGQVRCRVGPGRVPGAGRGPVRGTSAAGGNRINQFGPVLTTSRARSKSIGGIPDPQIPLGDPLSIPVASGGPAEKTGNLGETSPPWILRGFWEIRRLRPSLCSPAPDPPAPERAPKGGSPPGRPPPVGSSLTGQRPSLRVPPRHVGRLPPRW